MMPMRPPGSTPAAMKPLATASTSAANSRQLIGDHWAPAPLRENAAADGRLGGVATGKVGKASLGRDGGERCDDVVLHGYSS